MPPAPAENRPALARRAGYTPGPAQLVSEPISLTVQKSPRPPKAAVPPAQKASAPPDGLPPTRGNNKAKFEAGPEASRGQAFNAGDEHVATLRQWAEMIAQALGSDIRLVSIPHEYAVPCRPLLKGASPQHEVFDVSKAVHVLGYRDVVPTAEALARAARALAADPPSADVELALQDVFDYAAEDALLEAWERGDFAAMRAVKWKRQPGFTAAHYGVEANPFDGMTQQQKHRGVFDPALGKRV